MFHALLVAGLALSVTATGVHHRCSDVTFNVAVTSNNTVFASPPDPNNATAILNFIIDTVSGNPPATNGTTTISGTYAISGTYCVPRESKHVDKLEILLHGITYDKAMWAGYGFNKYNWHPYANSRGYATLALDRLGHGLSSIPDPLNVVQGQMHVEIVHQIIQAARTSSLPLNAIFSRRFKKVVLVGHSFGSFTSAAVAGQYPNDADAIVLTGFSTTINFVPIAEAQWGAAADVNPARFGTHPAGYVAMKRESDRTAAFYAGGYDPAIPPVDFELEDTVTIGEIGAIGSLLRPATAYKGRVLVVTPAEDLLLCRTPRAECVALLEKAGTQQFPNVSEYEYIIPENTGHDVTLHYTAPQTFEEVHDWLDQ